MTPGKSVVVVSIDRLGAGWLGPYGNSWLETPHFNRLTAESLLFETALADSPKLAQSCRAWWLGRHALQPDGTGRSLPQRANTAGAQSLLITDEPIVARHSLAAGFGELQFVEHPAARRNQVDIEETELFRLFSAAISAFESQREPALVWVHARGMSGPWDAPLELRNQFADEDDPEPRWAPRSGGEPVDGWSYLLTNGETNGRAVQNPSTHQASASPSRRFNECGRPRTTSLSPARMAVSGSGLNSIVRS